MDKPKINSYSLKGRVFPAIVAIVLPVFVFVHFYVSPELISFWNGLKHFSLVGDLALSSVIMFFLSQLGRIIGKNIFEKRYFKGELYMPTTQYLLYKDREYTEEYKEKFAAKTYHDFKIVLNTRQEESLDEITSRKKLVEAMAHIRKKLFNNKFLLQHNIEYGAMRNIIGGSVIGAIISIYNVLFFKYFSYNKVAIVLSLTTLCIYIILIALSKWIIVAFGKAYAKILIREYMTE